MSGDGYWNGIVDHGGVHLAYPAWRAYCDQLHLRLLDQWLGGTRFESALKTDLFDEAVGSGLVPELARISRRVVGLDLSGSIVDRAVSRHPFLEAQVADVRRTPFADGSFGFVLSNSTLDHFQDPRDLEQSLRELVRILAPGGQMLLTLDNPLNPIVAIRSRMPAGLFGRTSLAPYYVGHTLSLAPMVRLMEDFGCVVRSRGYLMHVPRLLFLHASRWFDAGTPGGRRWLRFMMGFEALARLPSAPFTGHFAAVLVVKRARAA